MNYRFVLVDSSNQAEPMQWVLPPPVVVGRSGNVDVSIGDPSISRRHCQFSLDPQGALVVRDLESMNGVYVDNQRVKKAVLVPGTLVRMGAITLRVEWTDDGITEQTSFGESCDVKLTQPMKTVYLKPNEFNDDDSG